MLYAIMCQDHEDSLKKRLSVRPEHLKRLEKLKQQGLLVLAGPHPAIDTEDPGTEGFSGSLIVAEFESLQDAQQWANQDPYMTAGVYKSISVKPFKQVSP
ncbi:YciL protein [hydrothermal vent metagenome]|uniref:YciL protein n=1 Tax=hydrothermal vent metagenome TaxID=652676 RepID=A0A3B1A6M8_9ZZZZ